MAYNPQAGDLGAVAVIRREVRQLLRSNLFVSALLVKLIAAFLFTSFFLKDHFIPFVTYAVVHLETNPYDHFIGLGVLDAFPYPPVMLGILGISGAFSVLVMSILGDASLPYILFLFRLPLLIADIIICVTLSILLPGKRDKLIIYYWCSPILFYITYVLGQLDIIPMMLLILSTIILFSKKPYASYVSFVILGAGIAAKISVLIAFPFLLMYVWKRYRSISKAVICTFLTGAVFGLAVLPFFSSGFVRMVLFSAQQARVFAFSLPIYGALALFIAPLAYTLLFLRFSGYKRITPDALMMILSLVFSIFMVLVPPQPGWFFWGIPFIIYFFTKFESVHKFGYWTLNVAYFAFFLTIAGSDFPHFLFLVFPILENAPDLYGIANSLGLPAELISSLAFSFLVATVLMTSYLIYKFGIQRNDDYYIRNRPISIGIGGDSASGKTTLSQIMTDTFGRRNVLVVNGDDMHKWERGNENWQKVTQLSPEGNKLHLDYGQAMLLVKGRPVFRRAYDHDKGIFTKPIKLSPTRFIIFGGLHPFYLKGMREVQDLKIFMEPEERLRKHWKILRDVRERKQTRKDVLYALRKREKDARKYVRPQREFADMILSYRTEKPLKDPGSERDIGPLVLRVQLDNSFDVEELRKALSNISTMSISARYLEDFERQSIEFSGFIAPQEIKRAVRRLVPDYNLILMQEPMWKSGINGIIQLLIIYYLSKNLNKHVRPNYE